MIEIQLNGEKTEISNNFTIEELLAKLIIDKNKVAVELNGAVVPRQKYSITKIVNKDVIEVVTFIGGG